MIIHRLPNFNSSFRFQILSNRYFVAVFKSTAAVATS